MVARLGVAPLARIVGSAGHSLEPGLMGIAPAWAMPKVIKAAGIAPDEIGVWEVHDAFAVQALGARGRVWPSCSRTTRHEPGSAFDGARLERGGVQVALP
ncbi:hypothetical protein [Planotetraspora kaengkrachanensis]|uniref:hypothetical protein n=1 Tax=Planotetraspora kaengkrachanensis TaxID=575193 RepID=UPI003570B5CE